MMIAIDMDARNFWAGVNGVWVENLTTNPGNPGDPANGLFPACASIGAEGLGAHRVDRHAPRMEPAGLRRRHASLLPRRRDGAGVLVRGLGARPPHV